MSQSDPYQFGFMDEKTNHITKDEDRKGFWGDTFLSDPIFIWTRIIHTVLLENKKKE